jgi:hypothetical protein
MRRIMWLNEILVSTIPEGWRVEAEGRLYRRPGEFTLEVRSGIDWFELHGDVDFEGLKADLPALLAAARRGDGLVPLGDSTFGLLPEDWLARGGRIAAMGTPEAQRHVGSGEPGVGVAHCHTDTRAPIEPRGAQRLEQRVVQIRRARDDKLSARLCRWGRGAMSYNGSSENRPNGSYRLAAEHPTCPRWSSYPANPDRPKGYGASPASGRAGATPSARRRRRTRESSGSPRQLPLVPNDWARVGYFAGARRRTSSNQFTTTCI